MGKSLGTLNTQSICISSDTLKLIAQIDEFKGAWRALGTRAPERLFALRRVATIESIGASTRIESSKLTNRDVDALLARVEIKSFATRDEQEVAGYEEVMALVFNAWEHIPFSENHITQLCGHVRFSENVRSVSPRSTYPTVLTKTLQLIDVTRV